MYTVLGKGLDYAALSALFVLYCTYSKDSRNTYERCSALLSILMAEFGGPNLCEWSISFEAGTGPQAVVTVFRSESVPERVLCWECFVVYRRELRLIPF